MSQYIVAKCVDRSNQRRHLNRNSAVFLRRIEPPLPDVYTIICEAGGRAHPFTVTGPAELVRIHTGPVRVSTDFIYLAAWIPAAELRRQGDVASALARMRRNAQYEFHPSRSDEQRRRIQAVPWGGTAPGFPATDQALLGVMQEMGMNSQATNVMLAPAPVRQAARQRLFELLEGVKQREYSGAFIIGAGDDVGIIRERLLANPRYRSADVQQRMDMIADWQQRLMVHR